MAQPQDATLVGPPATPDPGCAVQDALAHERRRLDALRQHDPEAAAHNPAALPIGLALSGGGIRSATVSLGVLQALAEARLLRRLDYLSTVSGGGYIGSWFSAILQGQRQAGSADAIGSAERLIWPGGPQEPVREAAEIGFLRAYSNYLTPRLGLFSADTLAALTGYLRNLFLSLLLAVCSVGLVLSVLHVMVALVAGLGGGPVALALPWLAWGAKGLLLLGTGCTALLLTLQSLDPRTRLRPGVLRAPMLQALQLLHAGVGRAMLPITAAGLLLAGVVFEVQRPQGVSLGDVLQFCLLLLLAIVGGALLAHLLLDFYDELNVGWQRLLLPSTLWHKLWQALDWQWALITLLAQNWRDALRYPFASLACALVATGLLAWCATLPAVPALVALFRGPVLAVLVAGVVFVVWLGAVGTLYAEPTREWLSRLLGSLVGVTLAWAATGLLVVLARPVLLWLVGGHWLAAAQAAWILPTAALLLLSILALRRQPAQGPAAGAGQRWVRAAVVLACVLVTLLFATTMTVGLQQWLLASAGIPVPAAGSLAGLVAAHHTGMAQVLSLQAGPPAVPGWPDGAFDTARWQAGTAWPAWVAWAGQLWGLAPVLSLLAASVLGTWLAFRYIDVNVFSLQNLYRNRLVRCYLGAARHATRMQNPYAGFDPADDLPLADLAAQRPLHLVNAALNITRGDDLALQQRKAASFCFSPLWCGYWLAAAPFGQRAPQGGYVPTAAYASEPGSAVRDQGVMLGTAMATSGAAVSPQMGFASSGLLAFVLTLFNVRLGRWLPNTTRAQAPALRARHSPGNAGTWYLKELLGRTNEKSDWVYLSDGGHFDNLGVYELVRRRCRFIVAVDAGADPAMGFGDLGNCVRKCRVDFGVDIRIDLQAFGHDAAAGRTKVSHVCGQLHYPAECGQPAFVGDILYIKASLPLVGTQVPADILSFQAENRQFPHQPTADQWFTESQFESYRQLGQWITRLALPDLQARLAAVAAAAPRPAAGPPQAGRP